MIRIISTRIVLACLLVLPSICLLLWLSMVVVKQPRGSQVVISPIVRIESSQADDLERGQQDASINSAELQKELDVANGM